MNNSKLAIKLSYTSGLHDVVLNELSKNPKFVISKEADDSIYLEFNVRQLPQIKKLQTVARAYITLENSKYHPTYINSHKSILGDLIEIVVSNSSEKFKTFKIACAGSNSPEVRSIAKYIEQTFNLVEAEEADLKIHFIRPGDLWGIGVQITPRPLSVRSYKVRHMSGAMDPTVANALNSFGDLRNAKSYLNVFSGSGTLLLEAGLNYSNIEKLVGFDNDKKHLTLAIQNIKEANLIKKIQIKEADIYDKPDFGTFDVIASDLPFGMAISKGEDIKKLYQAFIEYAEEKLNPEGKLLIYTSEYETLEKVISKSRFKIIKTLEIKSTTAVNSYLKTKIFVCEF